MRTARLAPASDRYKVMRELKKANLDSAMAISSIGQAAFIEQYTQILGKEVAAEVWSKASHVNAMTLTVYMDLRELFSSPNPKAILDTSNKKYQDAINDIHEKSRDFSIDLPTQPTIKKTIKKQLEKIQGLEDALKNILDRFSQVSERLSGVLQYTSIYLQQKSAIEQQLSTALELDADITTLLLEKLVKGLHNSSKVALDDFLALLTIDLSLEKFDSNKQIRRRGMVQAKQSGTYRLLIKPDEKLWVNERVINQTNQTIDLETGQFYNYRIEYAANNNPQTILSWITPSSSQEESIPVENLIPSFVIKSYRLLHKLALFINKFNIPADELNYLAKHSKDFRKFKLDQFPLEPKPDSTLFDQWLHLYSIFTFRDRFSQAKTRLIDVFAAAYQFTKDEQKNIEAAKEKLLALTNWNKEDLETLSGSTGFSLTKDDFRQGNKFDQLLKAFTAIGQLGISAQQLIDWTNNLYLAEPEFKQEKEDMVQSLKQVVKAKYGQDRWLKVAKPLRDELRRKQRSALAAYLIHEYRLENTNALYAKFLIDVEMEPCMMTSRIKQAISSVQLFVQRCLMNLEDEVSLSPEIANEWKWRKNYRVWEANRKVFLYPENWIEPELRDDKSPFFEELENELLQNEITNDTVEQAFLNYLEKLDEVARLEIVGMYEQKDEWYEWKEKRTVNSVLHVFGRTRNIPHIYYYRRWIDESYWTPWEKVDVDIEGDHLISVAWNRQLYIIWVVFNTSSTKKSLKIQLAWSKYSGSIWSRRQMTQTIDLGIKNKNRQKLGFRAWIRNMPNNNEALCIDFYRDSGDVALYHSILFPSAEVIKSIKLTSFYNEIEIYNDSDISFKLPYKTTLESTTFVESTTSNIFNDSFLIFGEYSYKTGWMQSGIGKKLLVVLDKTPGLFRLLLPHQYLPFAFDYHFFFQDKKHTFLVTPKFKYYFFLTLKFYQFSVFNHPYISFFLRKTSLYGINGLLNPNIHDPEAGSLYHQNIKNENVFAKTYLEEKPQSDRRILEPYPIESINFNPSESYSKYNWELFFHIPFLIAQKLSNDQKYEAAIQWFNYIFDPTLSSNEAYPARFWKVRPFYEVYKESNGVPKRIQELMILLSKGDPELEKQVTDWEKNPFKPHLIARHRLSAYMKTVVMKYIETLLAWADQLFRRDSIESINEATQLYILAAEILGSRPEQIPARKRKNFTYSDLEPRKIDPFSNVLLNIQDLLLSSGQNTNSSNKTQQQQSPTLDLLYFGIPHNDKLLKYWDMVEDRLFKIRHCMNIEGRVRQLPLFQPPIDPALLVRAAAAGIDLSSVLNDLYAPLPQYRFQVMLQKATELCADVKALGATLLSVLEKRDAEALALLRSNQEIQLLKAVKEVRKQQIEETKETLQSVQKSRAIAKTRHDYYRDIQYMNPREKLQFKLTIASLIKQVISQTTEIAASGSYNAPDVYVGGLVGPLGGGIELTKTSGGSMVGAGLQAFSRSLGVYASISNTLATIASTMGSYQRRWDDWKLQEKLAQKELDQIDKQITAAEIRVAIAEKELSNHELQIENANKVHAYMRNKFTNKELYNWMVSQISSIYFQSYQLAYDIAKRAEKAYR